MTTKEKMMMEQTNEIVCDMIKQTHFYENVKKGKGNKENIQKTK